MSLLFLDLDGVLHPTIASDDEFLEHLPALEDWLRQRRSVDVVITSSWRRSHSLEQMRCLFSTDLRDRIVGVTDVHWRWAYETTGEVPLTTSHERGREVLRWLAKHKASGRPWAALDDEPGQFVPGRRNVVACDPRTGLGTRQLAELDEVFGHTTPGQGTT